MAALLDTSVIVRYLTLDPPAQGAVAQTLIDGGDAFAIPSVALVESAFVLTRLYGIDRDVVVRLLVDLLGKSNLSVPEMPKTLAIQALSLCLGSGRVSFADALLWAAARASREAVIFTFDRRFPSSGVDVKVLR